MEAGEGPCLEEGRHRNLLYQQVRYFCYLVDFALQNFVHVETITLAKLKFLDTLFRLIIWLMH